MTNNWEEIEQFINNRTFKNPKISEMIAHYFLQFDIFQHSQNPQQIEQCIQNMIPYLSIKKIKPLEQIYIYEQEQDTVYFVLNGQAGMYLPNGETEKLRATKTYQEYKNNTMSLDSFYELREENLQKQKQLLLKQKKELDSNQKNGNKNQEEIKQIKVLQNNEDEIETLNINEQLLVEKIDKFEQNQIKIRAQISEEIKKANELNKQKGDNYINTQSKKLNNMYSLITVKETFSTFGQYSMYFGGRRWQTMANYSENHELTLVCIQGIQFHEIFQQVLNDVYFVYLGLINNFQMIKSLAENLALASGFTQNYGLKQEIYREQEMSEGLCFLKQGGQIFGFESFLLSGNLRYCQAISTSYDTQIIQIPYNKIKMILQYNSDKNIVRSIALQHLLELENKALNVKQGIQNVIGGYQSSYNAIVKSFQENIQKSKSVYSQVKHRENENKQSQLNINRYQQNLEQKYPNYEQNFNQGTFNNQNRNSQSQIDLKQLNQSGIHNNGEHGMSINVNNNFSNFYQLNNNSNVYSQMTNQNENNQKDDIQRKQKRNGTHLLTKFMQKQTQNQFALSPVQRGEADLNQYNKIKNQNKIRLGQERQTLIKLNNKVYDRIQRESERKKKTLKGEYYDDDYISQNYSKDTESKRQMGQVNRSFKNIDDYDREQEELRIKRLGVSTNFKINPHINSLETVRNEKKRKRTWRDKDQTSQYEKHDEFVKNQINEDKDIIKKLEKSIFRPDSHTSKKKTFIFDNSLQNQEEMSNLSQEVQRRKEKYYSNILSKSQFQNKISVLNQSADENNEVHNQNHQKSQFQVHAETENAQRKSNILKSYFRVRNSKVDSYSNLNQEFLEQNENGLKATNNNSSYFKVKTEISTSNIRYMDNSTSTNQEKNDKNLKDIWNLNLQKKGKKLSNGASLERGFFHFKQNDKNYAQSLNMSPLKSTNQKKSLKDQMSYKQIQQSIISLDNQLQLVDSGFVRSQGMRQDMSEKQKLKKHNQQIIQQQQQEEEEFGVQNKSDRNKKKGFLPRIGKSLVSLSHQDQSKSMGNLNNRSYNLNMNKSNIKNNRYDNLQLNQSQVGDKILIDKNGVSGKNDFQLNNLKISHLQGKFDQDDKKSNIGIYDLTYKEKQNLNKGNKHWLKQSNAFQSIQRQIYDANMQMAKQIMYQKNQKRFI
ncbi:Cyclic nucleotide-binding protein [Pseudocohnilembus persalinus]|uniref:Cyclic nucleotide-binding protein n=1 Tax=Pseudocohnilembus persalinus TaxID=266149 RepID=A0A0V0QYX2_PSEPJ|nr:Cyclic nucleotide-binding protein [Pseudocohnilembus persalinus]|eukprot:KRX07393.1 Cyclic nucleotide-binding protein [Pseudocohnilembus persalinus]